jgi:ATP sulfurylase
MSRATALPTPVEIGSPLPTDEQGNAPASPTRNPARRAFAAMAQGAPQVAVAALSDGLAVAAAVGALSDDERHRLREVIVATLSRHGYHPRTVTVLAMPTAPGPMES